MFRFAPSVALLALLALALSLNPAVAQLTTDNAQSACVEYGGCTTLGQNTFKTETQFAPVTPPAYTPALATIINPASDSAYLSSLAAAGGSRAFNSKQSSGATQTVGGGGGNVAAATATAQPENGSQQNESGGGAASIQLSMPSGAGSNELVNGAASAMNGLGRSVLVMVAGALVGGIFVL